MDISPASQDISAPTPGKTIATKKVKGRKRKLPGFVKLLLALVILGGIAGGVLLWRAQTTASAAAQPTIALAVTQGDLNVTVESNGNVQANTEKSVTYQIGGTVSAVLVKSGDKVTAGQTLVQQTDTTQKEAVAQAQAGLNTAQAKLDDLKKGPSEAAVASAKADVASAQAALYALKAGSTPQDIANAQTDLKTAQTNLATVKAGATAKELQDAQADLTAAQAAYDQVKAGASAEDLKNAEADLAGAQAAYDALTAPPSAADLKEAQSALDTANAKLAALKAGPTQAELSTAQLAVAQAKASITSIQTQAALDKQTAQLNLDKANRDLQQAQTTYGNIAGEVLDEQGNITVPSTNPKYAQYWTAYYAMKDAEQVQTQDLNLLNNTIQKEKDDVAAAQAKLDDAQTQLATVQAGATTADLTSAQHDVDSAQKTLDDLTKGPTKDQLATAQTAVTKAQTALDTLKAGPTASDLATAQTAVTKAQTTLDQLKAGPTADDLATAQAAVDKAQTALNALKAGSTPQSIAAANATVAQKQSTLATLMEPATASDIAAAEEAVATAQKAVDDANADLAKTVLVAPFSGTIASVTAEPNGTATVGAEALTIYDESGMQLVLAVSESDIQKIQVGQAASITIDALPNAVFTGTVSEVSNVSTTSQDVVTYAVNVQFNPGTQPVKTGMSATAKIVVESHAGVIQVPTRAITTQGRNKEITVLYGTAKTPVTIAVVTGASTSNMTEITSCVDTGNQCLRAGDEVAVTINATTTTNNTANQGFPGGGAFPGGGFTGGGGNFRRGTGGGTP
jgi:RND family efflux transporter MFP subunit